jgi:hypothetical protein
MLAASDPPDGAAFVFALEPAAPTGTAQDARAGTGADAELRMR